VLVNTSFNVRTEPIVCTRRMPTAGLWATDIELLVAGNRISQKGIRIRRCALTTRTISSPIEQGFSGRSRRGRLTPEHASDM
jgi:hypothetical protein